MDFEQREPADSAALHEQNTVPSKSTHAVGALDRPAEHDFGNRAGLSIVVDKNAENSTRVQSVDEDAVVEDGNTVKYAASGAKCAVARPDLQAPTNERGTEFNVGTITIEISPIRFRFDCNRRPTAVGA